MFTIISLNNLLSLAKKVEGRKQWPAPTKREIGNAYAENIEWEAYAEDAARSTPKVVRDKKGRFVKK